MKVKISSISPTSGYVIELNVLLPNGANASIAPVSTLTANQRWAKNVTIDGDDVQITKFDLVHTVSYTDCKGIVKTITETTSTVFAVPGGPAIVEPVIDIEKVLDVIIPNGISIVTLAVLDELPTMLPVKGNCAYSVFTLIPAVPA